jgi:hypothetical protein
VFAGAVREAVFADPEIIILVSRNFVPVAIKASLFNFPNQLDLLMPPAAAKSERLLYERLRPTAPAQQGLCVVDSTGRPISWVLMFSDRDGMLRYFPEVLTAYRNQKYAPSKATERWMQYPSQKLPDAYPAAATATANARAKTRAPLSAVPVCSDSCMSKPGRHTGSLTISMTVRAMDAHGKAVPNTIHQENYCRR